MDSNISKFAMATSKGPSTMVAIDLPVPPFANSHLVGNEFAQETATYYFRMRRIAEVDYRCVRAYLERDRFGPMPFLVKNVIRRLVIKIDWDMCKHTYFGEDSREDFAYDALADSIASLLILRHHKDMAIEIYLHPDMQFCPSLYRVLETMKPGYLSLREANVNIKVLGYEWFSVMDADDDTTSEQLNCYFTRTPEEWLDMKAKEIRAILEAKLRKRCKRVSISLAEWSLY
jgi:hypothetical protein